MSGRSKLRAGSSSNPGDTFTERCEECGRETPHSVRIELRTESRKQKNAAFSREPYRVATCSHCSRTTSLRMNNA